MQQQIESNLEDNINLMEYIAPENLSQNMTMITMNEGLSFKQ